jgi:hypothetical protein
MGDGDPNFFGSLIRCINEVQSIMFCWHKNALEVDWLTVASRSQRVNLLDLLPRQQIKPSCSIASIEMVLLSGASAANPVMIRANTPISLHRFQRLYNVFGEPYSAGASHHRKPLRLMKIIPLNTRLSSTRGLPRL